MIQGVHLNLEDVLYSRHQILLSLLFFLPFFFRGGYSVQAFYIKTDFLDLSLWYLFKSGTYFRAAPNGKSTVFNLPANPTMSIFGRFLALSTLTMIFLAVDL